jgi:hypothetical protein
VLKRVWTFLSTRFNALVAFLVLIFGAGIAYTYQKRRTATVQDLLAIEKAQQEMVRLRLEREALSQQAGVTRAELDAIDAQILARKQRILKIHGEVEGLTAEQTAEAFARLGY